MKGPPSNRAGAIEGVGLRFGNEGHPAPPPKPFFLTYLGGDVVELKGIGRFQNGTTAEVDRHVAAAYENLSDWRVEKRQPPRDPYS